MNENESKYYSPEEIRKIQERGVQIPDLRSVLIAREVKPEHILPGASSILVPESPEPKHKFIPQHILE